jgi:endonuclease I
MKRFLSFIPKHYWIGLSALLAILFTTASYAGYYDAITTSSSSFISDLQARIRSPYTKISYDNFDETNVANFASWQVDATHRAVRCVYSGEVYTYTPPFAWGYYSREHTWCHSWMPTYPSESGNEYSDQHHLFPTNQNNANGVRSNHPLGKVVNVTSSYLECKYGTDANGNNVFESRDAHKGDAARALLYMAVRYNGVSGYDWTFSTLSTKLVNSLGETFEDVNLLLQWHRQDPPSKWEVDRNNYVQSIQQNRNPFVDHPEYATYINFWNISKLNPVYATEPANQLSGLTTGLVDGHNIQLVWTDAAAGTQAPDGYLIQVSTSDNYYIPQDGVEYTDGNFGADSILVAHASYAGADNYTFTNLLPLTSYYFTIYSYTSSGSGINYKLDGTVPQLVRTTPEYQVYPAVSTYAAQSATINSIFASGSLINTGTSQVTAHGFVWNTSPSPDTTLATKTNYGTKASTGDFSGTLTGLSAETLYYLRAYAINSAGLAYGNEVNFYTLSAEPSSHVGSLSANALSQNQIQLSWGALGDADGYLILQKLGSSPTGLPSDGQSYSTGATLGNSIVTALLQGGTLSSYTASSLSAGTTYYFKVLPFASDGSHTGTYNYLTSGTIPEAYATTSTGTSPDTTGPAVVVNEYLNNSGSIATDEAVELATLQSGLTLAGYKIRDFNSAGGTPQGLITFSSNALWSNLPKGTFIVIGGTSSVPTEDTDTTDRIIKVRVPTSGSSNSWFTSYTGTFSIAGSSDAVEILDASGNHVHGLIHGSANASSFASPKGYYSSSLSSSSSLQFINTTAISDFDTSSASLVGSGASTLGSPNDTAQVTFFNWLIQIPVELSDFKAE